MSNYIPPDSRNVNLDFKKPIAKSKNLNFSRDHDNLAVLDAVINLSFDSEFLTESYTNNPLNAVINTAFEPEISVIRIDKFCSMDVEINTFINSDSEALFDINFELGVFLKSHFGYQKSKQISNVLVSRWSKPLIKNVSNIYGFDDSIQVQSSVSLNFENGQTLQSAIQLLHEQAIGLQSQCFFTWQENDRTFITRNSVFESGESLLVKTTLDWMELVRKRKNLTYSYEVAKSFEQKFSVLWDEGLEFRTSCGIRWDKTTSLHFKKRKVEPWDKPNIPINKKGRSVDLNFCCSLPKKSKSNASLNFAEDKCKVVKKYPSLKSKNWWYILNTLEVTRLDNGQKIQVYDGTYSTDKSRWCWSYTLRVPESEMIKLEPIDEQPVILKIMINGFEHHMMYETKSETKRFAETIFTLNGRSQTALNSNNYASTRSYLQENEKRSVQLCQEELDRIFSRTQLDWQLIDALGWIVEAESLTYTNLAPIDAIKMIVDAGGGFIYSEKHGDQLTIKSNYKKSFWEGLNNSDFNNVLNQGCVEEHMIDYNEAEFEYNGITLINPKNGNSARVSRRGTNADTMLGPVTNSLFNADSMAGFGKSELTKNTVTEIHTFQLPISQEIGEFLPGNIIAYNSDWWGVINSVSGSFSHASSKEEIKVERISRD